MSRTRETAGYISKRNGAWLIAWSGPATDDSTPDALFDVASSESVARRVCREGAREFGYEGGRWAKYSDRMYHLEAWWDEEADIVDRGSGEIYS